MAGLIVAAVIGIVAIRKADSEHYIGSQCDYCFTFGPTNEMDIGLSRDDVFLTAGAQSANSEEHADSYMKKMIDQVSTGTL